MAFIQVLHSCILQERKGNIKLGIVPVVFIYATILDDPCSLHFLWDVCWRSMYKASQRYYICSSVRVHVGRFPGCASVIRVNIVPQQEI